MTSAAAALTTTPSTGWILTIAVLSPYMLSKLTIAAYVMYQQYLYGLMGGSALASEADAYHVYFLVMGTMMGALRASAILMSKSWDCEASFDVDGDTNASREGSPLLGANVTHNGNSTRAHNIVFVEGGALLRGLSPEAPLESCGDSFKIILMGRKAASTPWSAADTQESDESEFRYIKGLTNRRRLVMASSFIVAVYGIVGSMVVYFGRYVVQGIARRTTPEILNAVDVFCNGAWWGVLPTLLLYNKEQLLLGEGRSLLPLLYGGVVYCVVGTVTASAWYAEHGQQGVGWSLSVSGWCAYLALKMHLHMEYLLLGEVWLWNADHLLLRSLWYETNSWSIVRGWLSRHIRTFLCLAVPLGLSNACSLVRQLVVAATTSECTTEAATAYSISNSYFSTIEIGLLAASSVISALIALRLSCWWYSLVCTVAVALALGAIPLVFCDQIAHFFGEAINGIERTQVASLLSDVRRFNALGFASYIMALASMCASAVLHGRCVVWAPLALVIAANVLGCLWSISFDAAGPDWCSYSIGGSLIANTFVAIGMWFLLIRRTSCFSIST